MELREHRLIPKGTRDFEKTSVLFYTTNKTIRYSKVFLRMRVRKPALRVKANGDIILQSNSGENILSAFNNCDFDVAVKEFL